MRSSLSLKSKTANTDLERLPNLESDFPLVTMFLPGDRSNLEVSKTSKPAKSSNQLENNEEKMALATIENYQAEPILAANLSTSPQTRKLSAQWLVVNGKLLCQWHLADR